MKLGSNVTEITDTTITIAPGETTATVDLNFLPDSVYDPDEIVQFEIVGGDRYVIGHSPVAGSSPYYGSTYNAPKPNLNDLENPELRTLNFNVPKNADPGTVVGRVDFTDPQGDELTYSLVTRRVSDYEYYYYDDYHSDIDLDESIVRSSNQDLDRDGIHPFTIDSSTGIITVTDYDDLDREPSYNPPVVYDENDPDYEPQPQLYNSGYYQLFVRVTDGTFDPHYDFAYGDDNQLYEASVVNIKVIDIPTTSRDDNVEGFSSSDIIKGLAGNDTIKGLAGNDTLMGSIGDDSLDGGSGADSLNGGPGDDELFGGEGNDNLLGGAGKDILSGMEGNDILIGMDGDDTLNGELGKDILFGMEGNDTISGGEENDTLNGGAGDDILSGGAGIDRLSGKAGADIFTLEVGLGQDLIIDFQDGVDRLGLPEDLSFGQINIIDVPIYSATMIQDDTSTEILAVLHGVEASLITEADFTTV